MRQPSTDDRGRVGYVDVVMTFATLVAFIAVAPWTFDIISKIQSEVDPLTGVLAGLLPALFLIYLIISIGVSAREGT